MSFGSGGRFYSGEGEHAVVAIGMDLRRRKTFRLFTQLDAVVPLYRLRTYDAVNQPVAYPHAFHAWFALSLGIGTGS